MPIILDHSVVAAIFEMKKLKGKFEDLEMLHLLAFKQSSAKLESVIEVYCDITLVSHQSARLHR